MVVFYFITYILYFLFFSSFEIKSINTRKKTKRHKFIHTYIYSYRDKDMQRICVYISNCKIMKFSSVSNKSSKFKSLK